MARSFAESFGAGELGWALGLLHDSGKASCAWQQRLREVEGGAGAVGIDHKQLGARRIAEVGGWPASMAILGHHGGLGERADLFDGPVDDEQGATWARFLQDVPEADTLLAGGRVLPAWDAPLTCEMGLRLAFSALVDADHLDTAAHFAGALGPAVRAPVDMSALVGRFDSARRSLLADRARAPIDVVRAQLYDAAVAAAEGPPGIYRLPAPTGAGKTLTAAAFALRHAAVHGKARVVVAVPFITITEQNAAVYRSLLGEDVVLEHHSNVSTDGCGTRGRGAVENWDAPFVVTTTVQLFDSLFGRKPSRCRKVHRLANAVIVLDEVQALPAQLLLPILDGLRVLCQHFGSTVLLTSATQPSFQRLSVWGELAGQIVDIVEQPAQLYEALRRVRYEWRLDPKPTLAEVADEVAAFRQALVVTSTVDAARTMWTLLRQRTTHLVRHLSTRMCPAHRRAVLEEVRSLLAVGEPVLLVATQLIEAGVDIDFPAVFRALAPADSLQQAAGRANREGLRSEPGLVVVFDAQDAPVPAFYRTAVHATLKHFGPGRADPDDLGALDRYYTGLYASLDLDHARRGTTIQRHRAGLNFRSVADGPLRDDAGLAGGGRDRDLAFRMLDDDSVTVAVSEGVGSLVDGPGPVQLLHQLRADQGARRDTLRALQPWLVTLPRRVAERADVAALLKPVVGDLMEWAGSYAADVGIDESEVGGDSIW